MSIDVHVRVRPGVEGSVWATAETVIHNTASATHKAFVFNKVHPATVTNTALFRPLEGLVHAAFEGKHITVMAYGQTGSGKTHSMLGVPSDLGIVPRAAKLLLELVRSHPTAQCSVALTVTEIYNDCVRDLLDPGCKELHIKDGTAPDYIVSTDANRVLIHSLDHFLEVSSQALGNRKTGVTNMNEHSSRSHMVLTLELRRGSRNSSISLVDLAGSESAARANTKGLQLQEGGHINQSLLSLGNVVNAIVEGRSHIPYRESKLTRLLRHCLGGNGLTCILCCVNPARDNQDTTTASLQFAQRAMKIKNDPVMVISAPPLFAHQYADAVSFAFGESVPEIAKGAYQRGLSDAYAYCVESTGSILSHSHSQVSLALHAMANCQRMLLASDQVCGAERITALEGELTKLKDAVAAVLSAKIVESKRAREHDAAVEERRSKVLRLEQDLDEKTKAFDTEASNLEYELYEARKHEVSECDVVVAEECAARWVLYRECIASAMELRQSFVERIVALLDSSLHEAVSHFPAANASVRGDPARSILAACGLDSSANVESLTTMLLQASARLDRIVADMEAAYHMVQEELPDELLQDAAPDTDAELIDRLRSLEEEEAALKERLATEAKNNADRRVRQAVDEAKRRQPSPSTPTAKQIACDAPVFTASSPAEKAWRAAAPVPRSSGAVAGYVSPYSQRAMRSPKAFAASPSAAAGKPHFVPPEKLALMGEQARSAMNLLRETREKLLIRSPKTQDAVVVSDDPIVISDDDDMPTAASNTSSRADRPLLPRPRNVSQTRVMPTDACSPPPTTISSQTSADENGGAVGIAARRRIENQPPRSAVERSLFHLSFSPQVEVSLHRGKPVSRSARSKS